MFGRSPRRSISPGQLSARDDVEVLDVRQPEEWRAGHIAGSTHIPMMEIPARAVELDRDRAIAVVCRSGQRSARVTAFLAEQGYDAMNVDGGLRAWSRAGLPLQSEDGTDGQVV